MNIEIRLVEDPRDLLEVFRFRYRVYVEEMERFQRYADHAERTVREPLDEGAANLAAYDGSSIVGVVRLNRGSERLGYYEHMYRMDMAGPWHPNATTITTKLMVAPSHRRSPVAVQLATAAFTHGYRGGSRFDFIDCNPPLDGFFARLGYRQVIPDVRHPEYGVVRPMLLVAADRAHLASLRSPFTSQLDLLPEDPAAASFGRELIRRGIAPSPHRLQASEGRS